jgi:hypothetical protein
MSLCRHNGSVNECLLVAVAYLLDRVKSCRVGMGAAAVTNDGPFDSELTHSRAVVSTGLEDTHLKSHTIPYHTIPIETSQNDGSRAIEINLVKQVHSGSYSTSTITMSRRSRHTSAFVERMRIRCGIVADTRNIGKGQR